MKSLIWLVPDCVTDVGMNILDTRGRFVNDSNFLSIDYFNLIV